MLALTLQFNCSNQSGALFLSRCFRLYFFFLSPSACVWSLRPHRLISSCVYFFLHTSHSVIQSFSHSYTDASMATFCGSEGFFGPIDAAMGDLTLCFQAMFIWIVPGCLFLVWGTNRARCLRGRHTIPMYMMEERDNGSILYPSYLLIVYSLVMIILRVVGVPSQSPFFYLVSNGITCAAWVCCFCNRCCQCCDCISIYKFICG
jgi:hypothetical protein